MALAFLAVLAAALPPPAVRLAETLAGTWDNRAQHAAAPAGVRVAPSVEGVWLDRQVAAFHRVHAPAIGLHVLYLEWRSPEGAISRQRIWNLRETPAGLEMDYYTVARPERFAGRGAIPGAFAALTPADLTGYGPACAVRWRPVGPRWHGRVEPGTCVITARSGRRMALDVDIAAAPGTLSYHERGVLENGDLAFDVPSFAPYRFTRTAP